MVNKIQKGRRTELEAKKMLISLGYLVDKKNASRWQSNDFYGLFDLLAIKTHDSHVRLIQIKSNMSDFYKSRKEIKHWLDIYKIQGISFEIWVKEPQKCWKREIFHIDPCEKEVHKKFEILYT